MSLKLENIGKNGKAAVAGALTAIEQRFTDDDVRALLDEAWLAPRAEVVGLTGPPGVGKSTLIDVLVRRWREKELTVGVIAVDPSSRITGGALLGDRTRIANNPDDQGVFVRSLAARGRLGGLSDQAFPAIVLMRALYDRVLVETVGVGQSEADITGAVDTVVLCVQPGSGDSLQFMKAGIMEIPDVAVVTKADFGARARQALSDLGGALSLSPGAAWTVPCVSVSSQTGEGIETLMGAIACHGAWLDEEGRRAARRVQQGSDWLAQTVTAQIGAVGRDLLSADLTVPKGCGVFAAARALAEKVAVSLR